MLQDFDGRLQCRDSMQAHTSFDLSSLLASEHTASTASSMSCREERKDIGCEHMLDITCKDGQMRRCALDGGCQLRAQLLRVGVAIVVGEAQARADATCKG